ncbi:MAG: preprotein translocase subunit SecG [Candidatus Omnitrophica bacterium CG23_combo_of_CG06-09_8_20_14_all_41_10]|uniref:Protein-export membrane protein SecG n=1 Tax=Candidatus Sherwoodlollariibacterium unditelluris TaxID=1974757 RepID=A0A2G9YKT5_9BACT|nr:MAG: preprotein translocase subunit SecG [Candidatus Omnitrophica bacterium CG23_combo_of_CG06-09_8_20_14_all_41_10]
MMTFIIVIHVIACILLIALVLIQRGRGSGLVESFSGVESMFGTKTSVFLTRTTTVCSVIFFLTCLSLALLSVRRSKSLLINVKPAGLALPKPINEEAKQEAIPAMPTEQSKPAQGAAK